MKYSRFVLTIGVLLMTIVFSCSCHENDDDDNDDSGDDDSGDDDNADDDYLPTIDENWSYDIVDKWAADCSLSFDAENNVYIFYYDPLRDGGSENLFYVTNQTDWQQEQIPIDGALSALSSSSNLSSAVGPDGELHLLYVVENDTAPIHELFYAVFEGDDWVITRISDTIDGMPSPSLVIDDNGILHMSYYEGTENDRNLMYANNSTGIWQFEVVETEAGKVTLYRHSVIKVENDIVYLSYIGLGTGQNENKLIMAKKTSAGWEKSIVDDDVRSCSMDVDSMGKIHIISYSLIGYIQDALLYISDFSGEWKTQIAADDYIGPSFSFAVDANQKGHIVHSGINNAETKLGAMYVNNSSGDWCSEEIFTDDADIISMAIDGDDKIHVAMNAGSYLVHLTREIEVE